MNIHPSNNTQKNENYLQFSIPNQDKKANTEGKYTKINTADPAKVNDTVFKVKLYAFKELGLLDKILCLTTGLRPTWLGDDFIKITRPDENNQPVTGYFRLSEVKDKLEESKTDESDKIKGYFDLRNRINSFSLKIIKQPTVFGELDQVIGHGGKETENKGLVNLKNKDKSTRPRELIQSQKPQDIDNQEKYPRDRLLDQVFTKAETNKALKETGESRREAEITDSDFIEIDLSDNKVKEITSKNQTLQQQLSNYYMVADTDKPFIANQIIEFVLNDTPRFFSSSIESEVVKNILKKGILKTYYDNTEYSPELLEKIIKYINYTEKYNKTEQRESILEVLNALKNVYSLEKIITGHNQTKTYDTPHYDGRLNLRLSLAQQELNQLITSHR